MCGRFTDLYTWDEIHAFYSLIGETPTNWGPNYNVCPTDPAGVILLRDGKRAFERMRWGLIPGWWSKPLKELRVTTFNARAETVRTKPFFREAFKRSRCLMPVSGYYEWHYENPDDKKEKPQPYYFTRRDGSVMTIAALCDTWRNKAENTNVRSCTMVITEPNKFVAEVHDRMPVVLESSQFDQWMNGTPDEAASLMRPASETILQKWPVSKRINSSRTPGDDPTLIEPVTD
ncbi:MAG: SOS response-associated peptidase [Alphaproteobacteria bacterium]